MRGGRDAGGFFWGNHMVSRGSRGDQSSSTKYEGRTIER